MSKRKRSSTTLAISTTSTVEEVCDWAATTLELSQRSVAILRQEEIKGCNLVKLTEKKLKEWSMPAGSIETLLDAVALLREPTGKKFRMRSAVCDQRRFQAASFLQEPLPLLVTNGAEWPYMYLPAVFFCS
jgi:hypothetical protein